MGKIGGLAAALIWAALPAARAATPPPPMTFTLARGDDPACAPDCPQWIAAEGQIMPGTARVFATFLAGMDGRRRPVVVNSNGGSVEDALAMGRLIRARKLAVAVGRTTPLPLAPGAQTPGLRPAYAVSYPAYCVSACAFLLAGGVERYANPLAYVGVHEIKQNMSQVFVTRRYLIHYLVVNGQRREMSREIVSENKRTIASTRIAPPEMNARVAAYLKEMGTDAKLVDIMQTATPDQMRRLSADEESATRLVTVSIDRNDLMRQAPPESGLAGAALEAGRTWPLGPSANGAERRFSARFSARRGGAGVAAVLAVENAAERLRYGLSPDDPPPLGRDFGDARQTSLFLKTASFCRDAQTGAAFVASEAPPTQAPGLPDPRAPLLRAPLWQIDGLAALTDEMCGAGSTRR